MCVISYLCEVSLRVGSLGGTVEIREQPHTSLAFFFLLLLPRSAISAAVTAWSTPALSSISEPKPKKKQIFLVTETTNSNGVYRVEPEPFLVTTHPMPPLLLDARARAADASSSALVVTVSLASLAEVHYAVFPVPTTEMRTEDGGVRMDIGEAIGHPPDDSGGSGVKNGSGWGCGNAGANVGERGGATALNDTAGLVVSGVVPSTTTAGLVLSAATEKDSKTAPGVVPSALLGADSKSSKLTSARSLEGDALEVMFRVEGLQAAQAYSVCLFTETPGSNGCVIAIKSTYRKAGGMVFFVCLDWMYIDHLGSDDVSVVWLYFFALAAHTYWCKRAPLGNTLVPSRSLAYNGEARNPDGYLHVRCFDSDPQPFIKSPRLGAATTLAYPSTSKFRVVRK